MSNKANDSVENARGQIIEKKQVGEFVESHSFILDLLYKFPSDNCRSVAITLPMFN